MKGREKQRWGHDCRKDVDRNLMTGRWETGKKFGLSCQSGQRRWKQRTCYDLRA